MEVTFDAIVSIIVHDAVHVANHNANTGVIIMDSPGNINMASDMNMTHILQNITPSVHDAPTPNSVPQENRAEAS